LRVSCRRVHISYKNNIESKKKSIIYYNIPLYRVDHKTFVRNLYFVACTQQAYDMVHTAGEIFYRVSERSTPL